MAMIQDCLSCDRGSIPRGVATDMQTKKCPRCDKNTAEPPHVCPFAEDVHNDSETLCDCCDDCTNECAWDI